MWTAFNYKDIDNQPFRNYPPQGYEVMVTDGEQEDVMWFMISSIEWRFQDPNHEDNFLTDNELPFQPTHWMYLDDYKVYNREKILNLIIKKYETDF